MVKEGDFAEVDFTGKTDGAVFETTLEAEAKKAGFNDANRVFKPVLVVAGKKNGRPWFGRRDFEVRGRRFQDYHDFARAGVRAEKPGDGAPHLLEQIPRAGHYSGSWHDFGD